MENNILSGYILCEYMGIYVLIENICNYVIMEGDYGGMGMLKSISLENYKCFKNKTDIEIAPLTVLCGVNSSGKSSILKSLLMLKQSFEENNVTNRAALNGKYIDNGTFNEILSKDSSNSFFSVGDAFVIEEVDGEDQKDIRSLRQLRRLYYNKNIFRCAITYSISIENSSESLYANKLKSISLKIELATDNSIILSSLIIDRKEKGKYSIKAVNIPDVTGRLGNIYIHDAICYFSNMTLNSIYERRMKKETKLFVPTLTALFNMIPLQYSQIQYIAPLRENPIRRYIADMEVNNVGISGENTALLLRGQKTHKKKGILGPQSEDDYRPSISHIEKRLSIDFVRSWMRYIGLGDLTLNINQEDLVKIEIDNHNLTDVGFGVSQVLPILAEGIAMSTNQTLLLEQPEIHLHPKMQMRMADFLLSMAVCNKSAIVETHSDHFVNRLVRRYMEDDKIRDLIKIYFIDKDEYGYSYIAPVIIDEVQGAICDNENFFFQFAGETSKIVDAGYRNLQKREQENATV